MFKVNLLLYLAVTTTCQSSTCANEEVQLTEYLMANYRGLGLVRPISDPAKTMDIKFQLTLEEFTELDEQRGLARIVASVAASWFDEYLRWNDSKVAFGSRIKTIALKGKDIFTPIIVPVGSRGDHAPIFQQSASNLESSLFWIEANGYVHATATESFETSCKLDVAEFPFDSQKCSFFFKVLQFGEPRFRLMIDNFSDTPQLPINENLRNDTEYLEFIELDEPISNSANNEHTGNSSNDSNDSSSDLSNTLVRFPNPMWQVVDVKGRQLPIQTSAIVYTITIQRQSNYYLWTIILPTASMAAIQASVFFLPFAPERIMYAITSVLALDIYQSNVQAKMHVSAEPIPLVRYSTSQLVMGIIITIESILVLSITNNPDPLPRWLVSIIEKVPSFESIFLTARHRIVMREQWRRAKTPNRSCTKPLTLIIEETPAPDERYHHRPKSSSVDDVDLLAVPKGKHSSNSADCVVSMADVADGTMSKPLSFQALPVARAKSSSHELGRISYMSTRSWFNRRILNSFFTTKQESIDENMKSHGQAEFPVENINNNELERHQLAVILDRMCLFVILSFFFMMPIGFFKISAW